jgi:hypothetical protein
LHERSMSVFHRFRQFLTWLRPEKLKNGQENWTLRNTHETFMQTVRNVERSEKITKSRSRSRFKNEDRKTVDLLIKYLKIDILIRPFLLYVIKLCISLNFLFSKLQKKTQINCLLTRKMHLTQFYYTNKFLKLKKKKEDCDHKRPM